MYESKKISARTIPPTHVGRQRRPDAVAAIQVIFDEATGEIEGMYIRQVIKQHTNRPLHLPNQHQLAEKFAHQHETGTNSFWIQVGVRVPLPDAWIEPDASIPDTIIYDDEEEDEPEVVEAPRTRPSINIPKRKRSNLGLEEEELGEDGWPVVPR